VWTEKPLEISVKEKVDSENSVMRKGGNRNFQVELEKALGIVFLLLKNTWKKQGGREKKN